MTLRRIVAALTLTLVLTGATVSVAAAQDGPVQDDIPAQCRTIIGCADAGPEPEHPGDRGGYAQLATAVVLFGAVGFIMTKIIRAARASQPDPVE